MEMEKSKNCTGEIELHVCRRVCKIYNLPGVSAKRIPEYLRYLRSYEKAFQDEVKSYEETRVTVERIFSQPLFFPLFFSFPVLLFKEGDFKVIGIS